MQTQQRSRVASLVLGFAFYLTGCTTTTPPGPLGTVTVNPVVGYPQPPTPPVSQQQTFNTILPVCETGRAKLTWHAFKDGPDAFITSYSLELLEASPGYEVTALDMSGFNRVPAPQGFVRRLRTGVKCYRESISGKSTKIANIEFDALGAVHDASLPWK